MFTDSFLEVLGKEGVASIVTWGTGEPHLAATWNSHIHKTEDNRLLIPVSGMKTTQNNIAVNSGVKMVIGSKEVMGQHGPGAGFLVNGTARFIREGDALAMMQKRFNWANCLMEITVTQVTQAV